MVFSSKIIAPLMKVSLKFISLYHLCCILALMLLYFVFNVFSAEILSYLVWFYVEGLLLGVIFYPLLKMLEATLSISNSVRWIIDGLICLMLMNIVSFISARRFLTINLIMDIKEGIGFEDNNLWIHAVSLFGFMLAGYLVSRNKRLTAMTASQRHEHKAER